MYFSKGVEKTDVNTSLHVPYGTPSCGMTGSVTFFTTAVLAIRWLFQSKAITAHVHAVAADESGKNNKRPSSRTYTTIVTVEKGNYEHQFFN